MAERGGAARHTFYYLLILVTLGFTALGVGQILFQIINSLFPETTYMYGSSFDDSTLRFGITAVIISAPLYWLCTRAVNRELANGNLGFHALVRKWLTYLILLIVSVTIIGDLMTIVYNFLSGELTEKFILKSLVVLGIAVLIFCYYHYDISREKVEKDGKVKLYRNIFVGVVLASLVAGLFFNVAPSDVRAQREDNDRVERLRNISYQIQNYYHDKEALPESLEVIQDQLYKGEIVDPVTDEPFPYKVIDKQNYEICATFAFSNRDRERNTYYWPDPDWLHDAGEQCFEKKVLEKNY